MAYLEELLPEFRKGAKIRKNHWEKDRYLFFKDKSITNQMDFLVSFTGLDFEDDWEIYQDPIDWDYIIKNKCLCWFYNQNFNLRMAYFLRNKENDEFLDDRGNYWEHCRPILRNEVTFYEDKEDE